MGKERFGWCFIGAGRIAHRVLKDLPYANGSYVASVHTRHHEQAQAFATLSGARAYATFKEAVLDPDVRAVYICTPHVSHSDSAIAALRLGKPVLCEKPFAINRRQAEATIHTAKEQGLYVMEGMWTRFSPAMRKALAWIAEGRIGTVRSLHANFAGQSPPDAPSRLYTRKDAGGSLLDIGVYTLALAQFVFGRQPSHIEAMADMLPTGVDGQCAMLLQYPSGAIARLFSSIDVNAKNDAHIYGDKGMIHIPSFAIPDRAELISADDEETFNANKDGEGFQFEFDMAVEDIRAGRLENEWISHAYTLDVMQTMDTVRERIGMLYEQDKDN